MDNSTIFTKTAKGVGEVAGRTKFLSRDFRKILKEVDGTASLGGLKEKLDSFPEDKLLDVLNALVQGDYIREFISPLTENSVFDFSSGSELEDALTMGDFLRYEQEMRSKNEIADKLKADAEAEARKKAERHVRNDEQARDKAHEKVRQEGMIQAKKFAEEQARQKAQNLARRQAEEKARQEAEARTRKIAEDQARREAEFEAERQAQIQAQKVADDQARREAEAQAAKVAAEQARQKEQELAQRQAEEKARQAALLQVKKDVEADARRESEALARKNAEEKARQEAEARARKKAEDQARREAEAQAAKVAAEQARQKKQELAQRHAEEKARQAALRQAKKDAEAKARRESEALARKNAEEKARQEAEARARKKAEDQARRDAELEAERQAQIQAQKDAEDQARRKAEEQARKLAEEQAFDRAQELARLEAEERAQREAEARAREEAEDQARKQAEEIAQRAIEAQIKKEADEKAQREAEIQAIKDAEEFVRREAEAQAKQIEAEQALRNAALQAQKIADEKNKAAQEKILRKQELDEEKRAKKEARKEADEAAKMGAQAEALRKAQEKKQIPIDKQKEKAAKAAEKASDKRSDKRYDKRSFSFAKPIVVLLFLLIVAGFGLVHLISFNGKIHLIQRDASAQFHQPVKIGSVRLALLPQPHWRLDGVSIGNEDQIKIREVYVPVGLGSLFKDRITFKSVELASPTVSEEGLGWLLFGKPQKGALKIASITATNIKFISPNINFPMTDAVAEMGGDGAWKKIVLDASDKSVHLEMRPQDEAAVQIELTADTFKVPFGSALVLDKFYAKGTANPDGLTVTEFGTALYDGIVTGNAKLSWGSTWSIKGDLNAKLIDAGKLLPSLLQNSKLEGSAKYAFQARTPDKLLLAPHLKGNFSLNNGTLLGVDFMSLLRSQNSRGKSNFAEITGAFNYENGRIQLRNMRLGAGIVSVNGNSDMDLNKNLSGNFVVDLKSPNTQMRSSLVLSGTLQEPSFHR